MAETGLVDAVTAKDTSQRRGESSTRTRGALARWLPPSASASRRAARAVERAFEKRQASRASISATPALTAISSAG